MNKLILPAFLAAGLVGFAGEASAHGLYFSVGYNVGSPKLESTKGTCYSGYQFCYPGFNEYLSSGPSGNKAGWPSVNWDGFGNWFDVGGVETWNFKPSGTLSFSVAAGWDFPLSPLRMELEYAHTSFKVKQFGLSIYSEGNVLLDDSLEYAAMDFGGDLDSDYPFEDNFDVEFSPSEYLDVSTTTLMLNTYFKIPLPVDGVTPYLGMGVGTFEMEVKGGWVQPDWSVPYFSPGESGACGVYSFEEGCESDVGEPGAPANMITGIKNRLAYQLMAGVEYRFPESPYIVGLEYKWLKVENAEDKDNNVRPGRYYVWDNWYNTYEHSQIALKFRYDFISNDY